METISKINEVRKTSNDSRQNQDQESFEWKVDLSSRDEEYLWISPTCEFRYYADRLLYSTFRDLFKRYFDFKLWLEPDDNGLSYVRVVRTKCKGFSYPLIVEFSFYLNSQLNNVDEKTLEERSILPPSINKQLKPLATELITYNNDSLRSSKRIVLCKSADLFSSMVENVVNIEFTVTFKY